MLELKEKTDLKNKYFSQLLYIAFPILIEGVVLQLQTLINRAFLGNSNEEYLSVVGNALFPYYTTNQILIAASTGLTILVAHNMGAGKQRRAAAFFEASLIFSTIFSIALFVLWLFFPNYIFSIMGVQEPIMDFCVKYAKILSIPLLILGIDVSAQAYLQGIGNTKPIMYAGLIRVVLNILLDWVLIFGKLGFPQMEIFGAAAAYTISNIISVSVLILYMTFSKKVKLNVSFINMSSYWIKFKDIIKVGLPTGVEILAWFMGNLIIIKILNKMDTMAVGIYSLTFEIDCLIFLVYNSLARASLTMVGNRIGQDKKNEAKEVVYSSMRYNFIFIIVVFILFIIFSEQILGIFTNDQNLINRSRFLLIITAVTFFPKSLNVITTSGIRGFGNTKWTLYTQIFGTVFIALTAYLSGVVFNLAILGIYITIFFDECIRASVNTIFLFKNIFRKDVKSYARD